MELKEGMYVRTKNGCICQILRTTYSKYLSRNKELCYEVDRPINANMELYDEDILKASNNIIDLIEVGDYVNGYKITEIIDGVRKYLKTEYKVNLSYVYFCFYENDIKSIVTKEQFESMNYKVKE